MRKVEAIIPPFAVEAAKSALLEIGIAGLTSSEVKVPGRRDAPTRTYRGAAFTRDLVPRCRLEIVVADDAVEKVGLVLEEACRAARGGDGLILTSPVVGAVRIRTGETGIAAIEV